MSKETPVPVVAGAVTKKCKCKHEFQDSTYGNQMRVMTPGMKNYYCTVCNAKHEFK